MSELVKMMIGGEDEEGGSTGSSDEEDHEIPLPNVKTEVLAKVIEFCKHHSVEKMPDIDKPLKSSNMKDVVPAWDAAFVEVEQDMLFNFNERGIPGRHNIFHIAALKRFVNVRHFFHRVMFAELDHFRQHFSLNVWERNFVVFLV